MVPAGKCLSFREVTYTFPDCPAAFMPHCAPRRFLILVLLCAGLLYCKKTTLACASGFDGVQYFGYRGDLQLEPCWRSQSYQLSLDTASAFSTSLVYATSDNTTFSVTNLTPATTYNVKLVGVGTDGQGAAAESKFTTQDADGLVIVGGCDKSIYALNARNGSVVWSYPTGNQILATPIIVDSVVYIGSVDGSLYAVNAANGSRKWTTPPMYSGSFITAPVAYSNGSVFVGDFGGWVYGFNATTGWQNWEWFSPDSYMNFNTAPVMSGDSTFFIGSYDGRVYNFNAATGTPRWSTASTGNPLTSGLALYNNTIYVGAIPKLYAFDAGTGALKWRGFITGFEDFEVSPTISDNKVLIGDDDGIFYAFDVTTGSVIWSEQLSNGSIGSSPMVAGSIVYVGDGGRCGRCL